jgi:flagellar biosynthesis/type III secretory pathway chaperone
MVANSVEELARVMQAEIELGDALMDVMSAKRVSIVTVNSDRLLSVSHQEEELLTPFQELERERLRICNRIMTGIDDDPSREASADLTIDAILRHIPATDAIRISTLARRLKTVVERILQTNEQNRVLMQRSLRFVQEMLRLATEDHTRQLVDQRL